MKQWRPKEGWEKERDQWLNIVGGKFADSGEVMEASVIYEAGADVMHEADVEEIEKHFVGKKVWHEGRWCYLLPEKFWETFKGGNNG